MLINEIILNDEKFVSVILNQDIKRIIEPIYLTQTSFAYDFLLFKLNPKLKVYELHGLYHEGVRAILAEKGYYKRYISPDKATIIHQQDCLIEEVSAENTKDVFQDYVFQFTKNIEFKFLSEKYSIPIEAIRTFFLRQSNIFFNDRWLEHLTTHDIPILKDTEYKSYFVFNNCFVQVSKKDGVEVNTLDELQEYCVWKSQRIDHDFKYVSNNTDNEFAKFCKNVTAGVIKRYDSLRSAMGYLSHDYFNPADGRAVLLYDEEKTDVNTPAGGTGKGLVANGLKRLRSQVKIDGKHWLSTNRFKLEMVRPSTQIVWIDDPKKDFDFTDLYSCLTDGWTVERKHMPQFFIKPDDSPKVMICSNVVLSREGTSNKRRQFIVELNNYYSGQIITGTEKPIENEHGILFSGKWTRKNWNSFYSFMIDNVSIFLKEGFISCELKNVNANFLVQQTNSDFVEWIEEYPVITGELYLTSALFEDFVKKYYGDVSSFKQRGFTNWVKKYATSINAEFIASATNGVSTFILKSKN
jgi:hypothetical protein